MRADLHTHSVYSDGRYTVEEVVAMAKARGVELLSITDHDTVEQVKPFFGCAKKAGIVPVAGTEISAYRGDIKLHTLAYNYDENNADFKAFCKALVDNSFTRAEYVLSKLKKYGVNITVEEAAEQRFSENTPVHSIHVCRAGAKKGYAKSDYAFYDKYMMYGKPGYCSQWRPTPEETVEVITAAGGLAVLAHPARIVMAADELKKLVKRLVCCGLGGIEANYSTHTKEQTEYYNALARETGIFATGGSDTHYVDEKRDFGVPVYHPDPELIKRLTK